MTVKHRSKNNSLERDSSTGEFVTKRNGRCITVNGRGVRASGHSVRQAKVAAKKMVRYNNNINSYIANDLYEMASAVSVESKSKSKIEEKYKDIKIKRSK